MTAAEIVELLQLQLPGAVGGSQIDAVDPSVRIKAEQLHAVCRFLRDEPSLRFDMLNLISAIDYFQPDPKLSDKVSWQPHLQLLYHLSSFARRHRIVLRVVLPRWQGETPGKLPEVSTVSDLWPTANWHEREVYDLCGVRFVGHDDLRRMYLPEDWVGHPLRKDYQFPAEYHGIPAK